MGNPCLAFSSKCGWNCLTGRGTWKCDGQHTMLVLEAGIKRKCECLQLHWTPRAESEHHAQNSLLSLQTDYQPKKNILAGVLRVTHLQLKSLCVAEQVFCLLLFPCHFTHCATQGLLLSWRQSPDKAEGLQPGERRPSWFLWDSLPPLLLSRRSGFRRIQHNTQKDLHIWEDFFK